MGGANSQENTLPVNNWTLIRRDHVHSNQSSKVSPGNNTKQQNLFKNDDGQFAQKFSLSSRDYISLKEEMQIYYYRFATKKPLVKVYEVIPEKGKSICSIQPHLQVYQEYIPYRLCDIRNLTHDSGLYVLSQALYGFQELFTKVGYFPVDQHFIGFNLGGNAKVWYNQNFASNRNPLDGIILMGINSNYSNLDKKMTQSQQYDMVQDVWLSIDKYSLFNEQFRQQSGGFVDCNFNRARSIVKNQIERRANVPDHISFGQSIISKLPLLQTANQQNNLSYSVKQKNIFNNQQFQNPKISLFNNNNQQVQSHQTQNRNKIDTNPDNIRIRNQIFENGYNQSMGHSISEKNQNYLAHESQNNNRSNLHPQKYSTRYY